MDISMNIKTQRKSLHLGHFKGDYSPLEGSISALEWEYCFYLKVYAGFSSWWQTLV